MRKVRESPPRSHGCQYTFVLVCYSLAVCGGGQVKFIYAAPVYASPSEEGWAPRARNYRMVFQVLEHHSPQHFFQSA